MFTSLTNPQNVMSNTTSLSYTPNDFFYNTASTNLGISFPTNCQYILKQDWNTKCNSVNLDKNMKDCTNMELCKNKSYSNELMDLQSNHAGNDEKYNNTESIYIYTLLNMINLIIGIIFLLFIINKYRKI